jgi:hypothetical protein
MDAANPNATTIEDCMNATPSWRTDLYSACGTLLSHAESIKLSKGLGAKMTPELKGPSVDMPYDSDGDGTGDYSQEDYAQQMIDEYKAARVKAKNVTKVSSRRHSAFISRLHTSGLPFPRTMTTWIHSPAHVTSIILEDRFQ